ncbi:MAG: Wzz/FepE/Etk N-terminal domain-containing protein [Pirellulaceae bacterium]|nr:hypothetical protein [Planctomycetales bacterium]
MNRDRSGASSATSLESVSVTSTLDLIELIWRRKRLIAVGIFLAIAAGVTYYGLATPKYESSADVLLIHKSPEVVTRDQRFESGFEDYVSTHLALIVSRMIVERAIDDSSLRSLEMFAYLGPEDDLAEAIIWDLEATSGPRNLGENADRIMRLTFRGTIATECPLVVNAIVDAYRAFLDEIYRDMSNDTVTLIDQARGVLQNDLQRQEEKYIQFRQESPLVARGTDEVNPLQDRLAAIEVQRSQLLILRAELEGQLRSLQDAREHGRDDQYLVALIANMRSQSSNGDNSNAASPNTLNAQLVQLADQEQQARQFFGPQHPHVQALRQRIAATQQMLATPGAAFSPSSAEPQPNDTAVTDASGDDSPGPATVERYVDYLQQELERLRISEQLLTDLYQREHDVAKELSGYQLKDESYRRNIDRTQQLYDSIISQLQEASLVEGYGGFEARVIASPLLGEKSSPRGKLVLAIAGLTGCCLGLILALGAEVTDKSFRSRHEIQTRLGAAVLAQIPSPPISHSLTNGSLSEHPRDSESAGGSVDPLLCTYLQPRSPCAEAFRGLRTSLLHHLGQRPHCVVQVTSPSPGDGTSAVTANLAVSLAQIGRRVLIIDGDLHWPRQHQIFGVSASGPAESPDAGCRPDREPAFPWPALTTSVPNVSLLPVGQFVDQFRDFYSSPEFGELLGAARRAFDFVLIDSEPLLVISDPCVIASHADAVLLTIRPTWDSRQRGLRAKETLDAVDITPMGIVVNGIGSDLGGSYQAEMDSFQYLSDTQQNER